MGILQKFISLNRTGKIGHLEFGNILPRIGRTAGKQQKNRKQSG